MIAIYLVAFVLAAVRILVAPPDPCVCPVELVRAFNAFKAVAHLFVGGLFSAAYVTRRLSGVCYVAQRADLRALSRKCFFTALTISLIELLVFLISHFA